MAKDTLNHYELSRIFWDFAFENPELVKPIHISIYFFAIEHCNRLGWKEKFGLPTSMVIDAIGMKSYNSYKTHFDDLVSWGFFKVIELSKNQYSSNIIALSLKVKASQKQDESTVKALDKALLKHASKHSESTGSIDKQVTIKQVTRILTHSFGEPEFTEIWQRWCKYRKEQYKQTYKSADSEQTAVNQLSKLSDNNLQTAIAIIEQSIANTWQGLFMLSKPKQSQPHLSQQQAPQVTHPPTRTVQDLLREREEKERLRRG